MQKLKIDLSHLSTQQGQDATRTDVVSFYSVSSRVLNHPVHTTLREAHLLYIACTATDPVDLMEDALVLAKDVRVRIRIPFI